jgi:hypothetical protein
MKYDDASWHLNENLPEARPRSAGATHVGMFLGWAIDSNSHGTLPTRLGAVDLDNYRRRIKTGTEVLLSCCDEKLTDEDLNHEGNAFAMDYYDSGAYLDHYAA